MRKLQPKKTMTWNQQGVSRRGISKEFQDVESARRFTHEDPEG